MTLYVDSSALLKRYLAEPDSSVADAIVVSDPELVTARHTAVEVRRTLSRELRGEDLAGAQAQFREDWAGIGVIELTDAVCESAARIAEVSGIRTLDALHLGAAERTGGGHLPIVTFDVRQAQAARSLGWIVLGL